MKGIVFDIKRFAVHDGPGIRTTVHMKGCPLKCIWCHNPEGIDPEPLRIMKKVWMGEKEFQQEEWVGIAYEAQELVDLLLKDRVFWEESGGGVTFSGGEPFMQYPFLLETVSILKNKDVHVAIDTCGLVSSRKLQEIAPLADLFLFDLKIINNLQHKEFTGVDNKLILENLDWLLKNNYPLRVRIPVVPECNFTNESLTQFLQYLSGKPVEAIDLLPYHAIAAAKYERFQIPNVLKNVPTVKKEELFHWKTRFETAGFQVLIGG